MADLNSNRGRVSHLIESGVVIPCPEAVEVAAEVDPTAVAPGVVIHSGSRLSGAETSIGPGCEIGAEAPATIENCQLGRQVQLKGGYFSGATFLDCTSMGSAAHVRPGTLLEEEANGAHAVGLKQTIFLPFVTAGSLINLCDCLVAGGTSRRHHSEIGSSYIHFNFTPHQDKATASLIGDIPRGVMLNQKPIFLGGQGGLIGPVRIAYGTVIAAGTMCRQDILEENRLYTGGPAVARELQPYSIGMYRSINRILRNNLTYLGNIWALKTWYALVRARLMRHDRFSSACHRGALRQLDAILEERHKRLAELAAKMPHSLELARNQFGEPPGDPFVQQKEFERSWPEMEKRLRSGPPERCLAQHCDVFLSEWDSVPDTSSYPEAVARISPEGRSAGSAWLQAIVDSYASLWKNM